MNDITTERQALLTDVERAAIQARLDAAGDVYGRDVAKDALADVSALLVENQRLRDTIREYATEAHADLSLWGRQAPKHTQESWDLDGDLAKWNDRLGVSGE